MNIISIQGLRKETDDKGNHLPFVISNRSDIMESYGNKVVTPVANWFSDKNLFETINKEFQKQKFDAILGNSAGGYMTFYFSNYYRVPALMLNPALASTSLAPTIQKMPKEFYDAPIYDKQMVLVGNRDLKIRNGGVDFHLVIEFFQSKGFFKVGNKMYVEEGMSHQVPTKVFIKIFEKFISFIN